MKIGTKVNVVGFSMDGGTVYELATIARWTKVCGPRMDGWYVIRYADGGKLVVRESRLVDVQS